MPGLRVTAYARKMALERIEHLSREGLDVAAFVSLAGAALAKAVPSGTDTQPTPTWMTLDPASLLVTSAIADGCGISTEEWAQFEYASPIPGNRVGDVIHNRDGVQTAREIAAADPGGAAEYVDLLKLIGVEHEVLAALRTRDGEHWGAVYLVRGSGASDFTREECDFLRVVAPHLAEGVRRGLLLGEASEPEGLDAPAIVVLNENLEPESFTPGAQQWLEDMPVLTPGGLPTALLSVAQAALSMGSAPEQTAAARVRCEHRGWVMLHGQALAGQSSRRIAVTLQHAGADRITPLLMAAYGLTEREEDVTRHVLRGDSTAKIALELGVSPHTVQQHLQNIFAKTSVNSRRELVGRIFSRHYEPRVVDNGERVRDAKPIRGGPFPDRRKVKAGGAGVASEPRQPRH